MLCGWFWALTCITTNAPPPDPCFSYDSILSKGKRSVNYTTDLVNDFVINDIHLTADTWYRPITDLGSDMPTFAPDMYKCSTKNPIWLNGTLPTVSEGAVTRQVCTRTETSTCEKSWNISVKNCLDDYYIYRLQQAQIQDSAYCFGSGSVSCPEGYSSVTGHYPNCTDAGFPKETVSPEVTSTLEPKVENNVITVTLQPVFRCNLGGNADSSYYYDVYWYINEKSVIDFKNIPHSSIKNADLLPEHWVGNHHMNMIVKCSVRMRFDEESLPSPYFDSLWFQAGVFPTKFQHQVIEGADTTIVYNVTVPVGCYDFNYLSFCEHIFYITQPNYQTNQLQCSNDNIKQQDLAFDNHQNCGIVIPSSNAGKDVIFNTTGYIDGKYNGRARSTKIRLMSKQQNLIDRSGVWDYVAIPEIEVVVTDADAKMKGRMCQAYNDPHFYTSDRRYYDFYGKGMYVLYRHRTRPYEVQVIFTSCNRNRASCHCGIAIRSGKSLLSVRLCNEVSTGVTHRSTGNTTPHTRKIICDDKSLYYEIKGRKYTVTLPIGTKIIFDVGKTLINYVIIKPSVLDIEESEGLCGFVSKENNYQTDDYLKSDGTTTQQSQEFARSWKVNDTNSLFVTHPKLLEETYYLSTYCECLTEGSDISNQNQLQCNLTQPMEPCHGQTVDDSFRSECSDGGEHRRRRSTDETDTSDDIDDFSDLIIDPGVYEETIEQSFEWTNGWTYEAAEQTCTSFLTQRFSDEIGEASGVQVSDYIHSCIDDIKIAGTTEYLTATLSTIQSSALTELKKNETLAEETTVDGISIFEHLANQLCENNCNNNGECVNGSCICNDNFGDFDCSKSKREAPSDVRIPSSGLCGTRARPCKRTNVYGQFSSDVVFCKRRHFQIEEKEKSYASDEVIMLATVYDAFKVSCDIDSSRKKRSVDGKTIMAEGFEISVSNDGQNYSETVVIIIYDDLCYSCNASTTTCVATVSCQTSPTKTPDTISNTVAMVIGIVCVVLVTLTVIFVSIFWRSKVNHRTKKKQTSPHLVDEFRGMNVPPSCFIGRMSGQPDRPATITSIGTFELGYGRKTPDHLFLAKAD